ncbi:MAG: multiheme c-type cytochrome [Pirellulaceae bacterium]|nr:multiheme c-type cytochrome [Pirellulaceae bacterium]
MHVANQGMVLLGGAMIAGLLAALGFQGVGDPAQVAGEQIDNSQPVGFPGSVIETKAVNDAVNDPGKFAGHEKCVDCHRTEVKSWMASKHSTRAFDLLRTSENALDYAESLGIAPGEIARSSLCLDCHASSKNNSDHTPGVVPSVTCESCHGGADGEDGWLNRHAVYGTRSTSRQQETEEHYLLREEFCREAGQIRSSQLYEMTKRCFSCHVIADEALSEAGHTHGAGFEYVEKSMGEVRHNFFLKPDENLKVATLWLEARQGEARTATGRLRVMFLLGQMVDLEVSLDNLSGGTEENDYTDELIGRIEDAYELLAEDVVEELEPQEDDPGFAEIAATVGIVEPIYEALDEDGFDPENKDIYSKAAREIALQAKEFAKRNGNELSAIDELELFSDDEFDGVYRPVESRIEKR